MIIIEMLKRDEGYRAAPYHCTEGFPTVGYGKKLGPRYAPLGAYTFEMPESVALAWLQNDVADVAMALRKFSDTHRALGACDCDERRAVLLAMAYQMGVNGLRGFKRALAACAARNWAGAARELLDSRWAEQTPERARRMAEQLKTGVVQ